MPVRLVSTGTWRGLVTNTVLPTPAAAGRAAPSAAGCRSATGRGRGGSPRCSRGWRASRSCSSSSSCSASTSCGWFSDLWDALSAIGFGYLVAGWTLQTVKTALTAFAWYSILRVAFPGGRVAFLQILAAYAAGVALNGFLPANLGTAVTLLMYVAIIPGANLPGVLGGMVVHKIFFSLAGAFVYVYLFLSASGSFDLELPALQDHPVVILALVAGAAMLLLDPRPDLLAQAQGLWAKAVQGGAILARRRDYALRVALPSFGAWLAKLGVIAVFLAGYGITVTFHTVMSVVGSGSIANVVSVTPGGVGVNQAADVAALSGVTDTATATAYSSASNSRSPPGTSPSPSCSWSGPSAGPAGSSSSSSPTPTRRSRSKSRRPGAPRPRRPNARRADHGRRSPMPAGDDTPANSSAVERVRRELREHGADQRAGDDVAGVVDPGVHARVGDERREPVQRDRRRRRARGRRRSRTRTRRRSARRETTSRTASARGGRPAPARPRGRGGAAAERLQAEVDDGRRHADRGEADRRRRAARDGRRRGQHGGRRQRQAGVVGGVREPRHRAVERGRRRLRDRRVEGDVDALGVFQPAACRRAPGPSSPRR